MVAPFSLTWITPTTLSCHLPVETSWRFYWSISRGRQVRSFCYLGRTIHSSGSCRPDVVRRIRIAAMAMDSLSKVWSRDRLTVTTKLRIYQTSIMSVFLYGAETWTLLAADLLDL